MQRARSHVPSRRRRLRLAVTALVLATGFSVVTHPSSPEDRVRLARALERGANRLVQLQRPDGSWPDDSRRAGDLRSAGRPARALVVAHEVHPDPRYLEAAELTARTLVRALPQNRRLANTQNLLFLAHFGAATGRPDLVDLARHLRRQTLERKGHEDPVVAAEALAARENPTRWLDGAWRNYLLWSAGETVDLARAVGDHEWADRFAVAVASDWAPKHDYKWWTMGAGRMLEALARVPGPEARRLASVQLAALTNNELLPGIAWNDTPYDTHVYAQETASALQGLLASNEPGAHERAVEGLLFLASRQAPDGGWASTLSLLDVQLAPGESGYVPPAELALDESAEQDAEIVLSLAMGLGAHPDRPVVRSRPVS